MTNPESDAPSKPGDHVATGAPTGAATGDLPAGFVVGEYRVESLLGRGGMGAVYAARQPEIGARVAVKVLAADLSRDPRLVQRFVDEARAVNKIRHPNIIDIFAFGRLADGRQYLVMEHLEGETLAARLAGGPLPIADARRLLLQICEALEAAHAEKIVHRDLKPENIWIATPRHGQPFVKLLDFGIAKLLESRGATPATDAGVAMGTPHYMSPEQCRGDAVDHRTDLYAMGVMLYLMWSGRLPFEGQSFLAVVTQQLTVAPVPPSVHRPLPPRLERLILSCLEKDPARRPASAQALGVELGAVLADAPASATLPAARAPAVTGAPRVAGETGPGAAPPPAAQPGSRPSRARRLAIAGAAGALLGLLAAGGVRLGTRGRPAPAGVAVAPRSAPATAPAPASASAPAPVAIPAPRVEAAPRAAPALTPSLPRPAVAVAPPRSAQPALVRAPGAKPLARAASTSTSTSTNPSAPPAGPPRPRSEERGFLRENPFR